MMYSTPTLNDSMTGYYSNSLDYQSNLINGVNTNIYSNANSFIKHSPPSHSPLPEDDMHKRKRSKTNTRNTRKVMIEKKRRDRINVCLDELRKLVPAANEKQGSAKLEKAEILQMTVDHLKSLHSKGFDTFSFEPHTFATKHLVIGFRECAEQVTRHLSSAEGFAFNEPLKSRLINHLQRYITQREYELKSNSANGLAWNPNLFLIPPSTSATSQANGNSNVNTTSSIATNAQQMLNSTTSLSPITTLTHSSLSSHSNSSITSNSSSYQTQVNQQNDSTPTSPLCESPASNSSLNNNSQLTASQLLNQHSYTDNNNNTSTSSSSSQNTSLHSESNSSLNQSSQLSNVSNAINNAINSINSNDDTQSLLLMGPPPPRTFKVTLPLNSVSSNSPNTSSAELTYTNMQPSPTYSGHHHPDSINANGYATNSLPNTFSNSLSNPYVAAAVAHHSNQIHHHSPYLNNFNSAAFAYGTSVGQTMSGASVVANVVSLPNHPAGQSSMVNQQYSATAKSSYVRPWGSENMMKIAY